MVLMSGASYIDADYIELASSMRHRERDYMRAPTAAKTVAVPTSTQSTAGFG
jgi:hypothetical protein